MLTLKNIKIIKMAKKGKNSPHFKNRVGEKYITNQGYTLEIIDCNGAFDNTIIFLDGKDTVLKKIRYSNIKRGYINNPFHTSVHGLGYIGIGEYKTSVDGKKTKSYTRWVNMIQRTASNVRKAQLPTYQEAVVCEEWECFQNFAEWFGGNYIEGFELDKDILVKGNKIYSPETCCFVPQEINSLFTKTDALRGKYPIGVHKQGIKFIAQLNKGKGHQHYLGTYDTLKKAFQAYKTAKEEYIKETADRWKDLIDPKVYQAMYKYEVEITD